MTLTKGYFDLQVNGYAGVDFNGPNVDADSLHRACERLEADGVAGVLVAIITAPLNVMIDRLSTIARLRESDTLVQKIIAGFHIEGPFLNDAPGYAGAHPAAAMMNADTDAMGRLLEAAGGMTRLVTLAPERDSGGSMTKMLRSQGITVSAGHTNATLDELRCAIDGGLTMFTHLGNGCPVEMHRHDNIVQRVLSLREKLTIMFIADGAHVPFVALKNYLTLTGIERTVVVTDAMTAAAMPPGRYPLGGMEVEVGQDRVARMPGSRNLAGSAITMPQTMVNLVEELGLSRDQAMTLVSGNPRKAIA